MTIISTKPQLMQFFSDTFLEKTARRCSFMERLRNIGPQSLVLSWIAALSKGNCTSIADLHRQFNGTCLSEKHTVAYKSFHNQLRKSAFADFMKTLVTFAMVQLIENVLPPFIVRGSQSLNPLIVSARNGQGRQLPTLAGKKLRDISRKNNHDEVLDFTCRRGRFEFRVIRRWFAQEKRFCFWLTNLPPSDFTADDIMALYRCRWQVAGLPLYRMIYGKTLPEPLTMQDDLRISLETDDELLFTHAGLEGVLLSECVRLKQCRIANKLSNLFIRCKSREIRRKLIWLCWYDLMLGAPLNDWLDNLKLMNQEELCFWLGQRQEENAALTSLMDEYVIFTRY